MLLTHLGLAAAVCATLFMTETSMAMRAMLTGIALLPLVATLPGLLAGRHSVLPWLALTLVAYTGLGTVEVIATGSLAASLLLLLALLELALALSLRRADRRQ
jgi:hypothetical protein